MAAEQVASMQDCRGPHAVPHAPQLCGSSVRSVQKVSSQHVSPDGHSAPVPHDSAHRPLTQRPLEQDSGSHCSAASGCVTSAPASYGGLVVVHAASASAKAIEGERTGFMDDPSCIG